MNHGLLFGLIASAIAIAGVIVSVTTKLNHTDHNSDMIKENKDDFEKHVKKSDENFSKVWHRLDEISDAVSFIKGKMNSN